MIPNETAFIDKLGNYFTMDETLTTLSFTVLENGVARRSEWQRAQVSLLSSRDVSGKFEIAAFI